MNIFSHLSLTSPLDIFLHDMFFVIFVCDITYSIANFFGFEIASPIWHSFACKNAYACTNVLGPFIGVSFEGFLQN